MVTKLKLNLFLLVISILPQPISLRGFWSIRTAKKSQSFASGGKTRALSVWLKKCSPKQQRSFTRVLADGML